MELNALTRWESIGKDLYRTGTVGREIARLKARSKATEAARTDAQARRHEVEETMEAGTPTGHETRSAVASARGSRTQLSDLEAQLEEERLLIDKWRRLREQGKKLRIEEERLEQQTVHRDVFPPGHQQWVYFSYRLLRRFTKGFLFGYTGKFAFAFIGLCLRHKLNLTRLLPDLAALFFKRELWSYGAFLGSFLTLFESSIRLLKMKSWLSRQMLTRHHRSVRVILSASVAAAVAIRFLPADTRLGISMFFCVRALEILVRYLVEREEKPYAQHGAPAAAAPAPAQAEQPKAATAMAAAVGAHDPLEHAALKSATGIDAAASASVNSANSVAAAPSAAAPSANKSVLLLDPSVDTKSELILPAPSALERARRSLKRAVVKLAALPASDHFDTLVMALASSQVIWAWLFNRHTVEPSYLRFLDHQGGRDPCVQHGYVALHQGDRVIPSKYLAQINAARSAEGRGMLDLQQPLQSLMCCVLHRNHESCASATLDFFKKAYLRALPVYLPVYALPVLLFKHRQLISRPLSILVPTALNLLRSSLFLSSYCTASWAVACATTQLGLANSLKGALAGFAGGSMVAMEKKGRRVELALYVLSQSLPSTWRTLVQWGVVGPVPHGESAIFVASMAVILWSYVTRPHLMRSSYLGLFMWFFGSGGRAAGFSTRAVEHSTPKAQLDGGARNNNDDASDSALHPHGQHRLHAAVNAADKATHILSTPVAVAAASAATALPHNNVDVTAAAGSLSSSSSSPPAPALHSPGALVMQSRHGHSSRLSTVSDELEDMTDGSGAPSPRTQLADVAENNE